MTLQERFAAKRFFVAGKMRKGDDPSQFVRRGIVGLTRHGRVRHSATYHSKGLCAEIREAEDEPRGGILQ